MSEWMTFEQLQAARAEDKDARRFDPFEPETTFTVEVEALDVEGEELVLIARGMGGRVSREDVVGARRAADGSRWSVRIKRGARVLLFRGVIAECDEDLGDLHLGASDGPRSEHRDGPRDDRRDARDDGPFGAGGRECGECRDQNGCNGCGND